MNAREARAVVHLCVASELISGKLLNVDHLNEADGERMTNAGLSWAWEILHRYGFETPFVTVEEATCAVLARSKGRR